MYVNKFVPQNTRPEPWPMTILALKNYVHFLIELDSCFGYAHRKNDL
jgi:hypothetical protein